MQFGYCLPTFAGAGDVHPRTPLLERVESGHLERSIIEAEALGYASLWVADHLMLGREQLILECWTVMSWAARLTTRIRLGSIHLACLFRPPALTAKMASSLDVISGGRLEFFYEMGHRGSKGEAEAYGFDFPDDDSRLAAFEEALKIIKAMWTEDRPSFRGDHYQVREVINYPKPLQRPHPPIWIGTLGGEGISSSIAPNEKVVDLIARHADGWNNTPASLEHCRAMLGLLDRACERNGREPGDLRKSLETQVLVADTEGEARRIKDLIQARNPRTYGGTRWDAGTGQYLIGDADAVVRRIRDYADLGIDTFQLWFMDYPSLDGMRTFARRVAPYFSDGNSGIRT